MVSLVKRETRRQSVPSIHNQEKKCVLTLSKESRSRAVLVDLASRRVDRIWICEEEAIISSQILERERQRKEERDQQTDRRRKKEGERGKRVRQGDGEQVGHGGGGRESALTRRCRKPSMHWIFSDTSEWTSPFFSL